jgi:hypothetical protein
MLITLLLSVLSFDPIQVKQNAIDPVQRIFSFTGEFSATESFHEPDAETGAERHRLLGAFGAHGVRIQFYEFSEGHIELLWAEALDDTEWNYEHPSRRDVAMAADLLAQELAPVVPEVVRAVGYRWRGDSEGVDYELSLVIVLEGRKMIHRVDYTNDSPESITLVSVVSIGEQTEK